jgi:hypothetical protein
MAPLSEIMQQIAGQIQSTLAGTVDPLIEGLQVNPLLTWNATPPAIDIYPADPFQEGIAFGHGKNEITFVVRARVNTPDQDSSQELLLEMMDPEGERSVALAILADQTLGGKVETLGVEGPSDFGVFQDPGQSATLGCTWKVVVTP